MQLTNEQTILLIGELTAAKRAVEIQLGMANSQLGELQTKLNKLEEENVKAEKQRAIESDTTD